MIAMLQSLPIGNAVRVFLTLPSSNATAWMVLRRTDANFAGPDDPGAVRVYSPDPASVVLLDTAGLVNGTEYFYADYSLVEGDWVAGSIMAATPAATYGADCDDPQAFVRERLELGLAVEVARGTLKPQSGVIRVLTAPYMTDANVSFPVVSVHLANQAPAERAIGEELMADERQADGSWIGVEGWLSSVSLNIVAASLNLEERIALRKALQRIVLGNLQVFDARGLVRITFSQRDDEQFREDNTPVFMSVGSFECTAPYFVSNPAPAIADVTVQATSIEGSP